MSAIKVPKGYIYSNRYYQVFVETDITRKQYKRSHSAANKNINPCYYLRKKVKEPQGSMRVTETFLKLTYKIFYITRLRACVSILMNCLKNNEAIQSCYQNWVMMAFNNKHLNKNSTIVHLVAQTYSRGPNTIFYKILSPNTNLLYTRN